MNQNNVQTSSVSVFIVDFNLFWIGVPFLTTENFRKFCFSGGIEMEQLKWVK